MKLICTNIDYDQDGQGNLIVNQCGIVQVVDTMNNQFELSYDELNASQKQKVDDYINLIISLSPINNP